MPRSTHDRSAHDGRSEDVGTRGRSSHRFGVAAIVALLALAMPASASAGTVKVSQGATGDATFVGADAKCPKGERATGGGFATAAPTDGAYIEIFESRKFGQDTWRVIGQISDLNKTFQSRKVEVYVYCSPSAPATTEVSKTGVTKDTSLVSFTDAKCPAASPRGRGKDRRRGRAAATGMEAKAVGFSGEPPVGGGAGFLPGYTRRGAVLTPGTVKAGRSSLLGHQGQSYRTFAYCAEAPKIAAKTGYTNTEEGPGSQRIAFSGECKRVPIKNSKKTKRTTPSAGGFDQPNAIWGSDFLGTGSYYTIISSLRVGRQWWVIGIHHGTTPQGRAEYLVSEAYCS